MRWRRRWANDCAIRPVQELPNARITFFAERVPKQLERAEQAWNKYDDANREKRTMGVNDGR